MRARFCGVLLALVASGCAGGVGGYPEVGAGEFAEDDACMNDPEVFAYCGDGDSTFDPNDPDLVTWFDGIDRLNARQVEMWDLPEAMVGARLVESTNMPNRSEWASCARYEDDDRWWKVCRRAQGTTVLAVTASGSR